MRTIIYLLNTKTNHLKKLEDMLSVLNKSTESIPPKKNKSPPTIIKLEENQIPKDNYSFNNLYPE